ncbi:MAG: class I SAM-dependent methyltransferase [Macromonas bipunctata]|nr:class I SAM-dependent methyltransferase [Macromonas bipunctata]
MSAQTCPICNSVHFSTLLKREQVPVHQNLILATREAALAVARGDLDFVLCQDCGFVFNRAFDLSLLAYGKDYDNTQTYSDYFDDYLNGLVKYLVEEQGLRNSTIVEVGCGKGHFLRKFVNYPDTNNRGIGFDPSYIGPDSELEGRLIFRRCYYDDSCTDVQADAVVCRHVIEHVPEPLALLKTVRSALDNSPQAKVFFETPCVDWILHNKVIWDFFYEHCSLFTKNSLRTAFEAAGFSVKNIRHIFNGQYLWLEATTDATKNKTKKNYNDSNLPKLAAEYLKSEQQERSTWKTKLEFLRQQGSISIWGAGAKGSTFANLIDSNQSLIDCVVDLNPKKQGHYIAGTGHLIVSPFDISKRRICSAILMNPNYREENMRLLSDLGITLNLVDWNHS